MRLTRQEFVDIMGRAMEETPDLIDDQKANLAMVAATATRVARGSFSYNGIGCPARQAGLDLGRRLIFAMTFDALTADLAGPPLNRDRLVDIDD